MTYPDTRYAAHTMLPHPGGATDHSTPATRPFATVLDLTFMILSDFVLPFGP